MPKAIIYEQRSKKKKKFYIYIKKLTRFENILLLYIQH